MFLNKTEQIFGFARMKWFYYKYKYYLHPIFRISLNFGQIAYG